RTRPRADHEETRARMVRHQEARAERPHDFHLRSFRKVAQVIRRDALNPFAIVIVCYALHRERNVVVARALALARARDRVEPNVVRLAIRVGAGGYDADRLTFEHRKRGAAEVEDDVTDGGRS